MKNKIPNIYGVAKKNGKELDVINSLPILFRKTSAANLAKELNKLVEKKVFVAVQISIVDKNGEIFTKTLNKSK